MEGREKMTKEKLIFMYCEKTEKEATMNKPCYPAEMC